MLRSLKAPACIAALGTAALLAPAAAGAASADDSGIRPGAQTTTDGGGTCTANFVFDDAAGNRYIGQAAHCAGTGGADQVDGCSAPSQPLGTAVRVEGASRPGTLAYSSWLAMQRNGERDPDACQFNDIALVRLDPVDEAAANPTIPVLGGPSGIADGVANGATVLSYGNSPLRGGIDLLKPKRGVSLGTTGNGWSHTVLTLTPGIPGDSGSGFVDDDGRALGVLSTLNILPATGTNGVSNLRKMLDYARAKGGVDVHLADGAGAPARRLFGVL